MIGSPIVFQTAPPQPWSNALATCPYVLVGGPEARQKGFGLSMPAKFVRRSAILTVLYRPLPSFYPPSLFPSASHLSVSRPGRPPPRRLRSPPHRLRNHRRQRLWDQCAALPSSVLAARSRRSPCRTESSRCRSSFALPALSRRHCPARAAAPR